MTFVLVFSLGWILILGGVGLVWWKRRRDQAPMVVSPQWREAHRYKRHGDIPAGTSRQEEGR